MDGGRERYSRHTLLAEFGEAGQAKVGDATVLVVGCGALGSNIAGTLTRAGVGTLRIVDRDVLEWSNLQRQTLFDERDVEERIPKARAAARRLKRINTAVNVEAFVRDVTPASVESLLEGVDLVLDGTDNLETRYLLNDACVKAGLPWIYAGVVGTSGMSFTVLPGEGPCLRCVFPDPPPAGVLPTCDTVGILNTVPAVMAAVQATEALKLLVGSDAVRRTMLHLDLWANAFRLVEIERDADCPCCGRGEYPFLDAERTAWVTSLCGRNAVQITPAEERAVDLKRLVDPLCNVGEVRFNGFLLDFAAEGLQMTLFPDGRVIVKGTTDEAAARSFHAKYLGS